MPECPHCSAGMSYMAEHDLTPKTVSVMHSCPNPDCGVGVIRVMRDA